MINEEMSTDALKRRITYLERQLAEEIIKKEHFKYRLDRAIEEIIKLVPVSKDGNEYLTDCDVCMKIVDIIVRGAVCQK